MINEISSWVWLSLVSILCWFLEQSAIILVYLKFWSCKVYQIFLGTTRLQDLSLTARITLIAIMVWKLQKSQDDTDVLSRIWTSFGCLLFWTNITIEFGKVFYRKVVANSLSFLTVKAITILDQQNKSYVHFTALVIFISRGKSGYLFLPCT